MLPALVSARHCSKPHVKWDARQAADASSRTSGTSTKALVRFTKPQASAQRTCSWISSSDLDRPARSRTGQQWLFREVVVLAQHCEIAAVRHDNRTLFRRSWKPARPYIWRLIILIRLTWPSTIPEFQGRVRPAMTASRSRSRPLTKMCRPGKSSVRTAVIHWSNRSPWSWVRICAKSRTCLVRASSSGQCARTDLSLSRSFSGRASGRVRIHPATVRGVGGRASAGAALRNGRR